MLNHLFSVKWWILISTHKIGYIIMITSTRSNIRKCDWCDIGLERCALLIMWTDRRTMRLERYERIKSINVLNYNFDIKKLVLLFSSLWFCFISVEGVNHNNNVISGNIRCLYSHLNALLSFKFWFWSCQFGVDYYVISRWTFNLQRPIVFFWTLVVLNQILEPNLEWGENHL